jgi:isoleucyl-tRNA synthetase
VPIEELRKANVIGSSLQAAVELPLNTAERTLLDEAAWSEIAIVSSVTLVPGTDESPARVTPASGDKCVRCWRVLPEVGSNPAHPSLCLRCADAVDSGLTCRPAA